MQRRSSFLLLFCDLFIAFLLSYCASLLIQFCPAALLRTHQRASCPVHKGRIHRKINTVQIRRSHSSIFRIFTYILQWLKGPFSKIIEWGWFLHVLCNLRIPWISNMHSKFERQFSILWVLEIAIKLGFNLSLIGGLLEFLMLPAPAPKK